MRGDLSGLNAHARNKPILNPPDMALRASFPHRVQQSVPAGDCCVYFMWSADWDLLYIGVTDSPSRRFAEHRRKPWWTEVHHMEIEQYGSRDRALARERETIAGWDPIHNIARPRASR